jgi:hypothetical protein
VDARHIFAGVNDVSAMKKQLSRDRSESHGHGGDREDQGDANVLPPFALKRVNPNGTQCSTCSWLKLCMGTSCHKYSLIV